MKLETFVVEQRMTHSAYRKPVSEEKMVVRKQCRACSQLGVSRALATMLPAVHNEVFLLRFKCDSCGFAQCEIKRDGKEEKKKKRKKKEKKKNLFIFFQIGFSSIGRRFVFTVSTPIDLQRK
jgi:C4-type Zn-finger protein